MSGLLSVLWVCDFEGVCVFCFDEDIIDFEVRIPYLKSINEFLCPF